MKPKVGISMGDPAGIGPEIIIKTLELEDVYERCYPLVVGDAKTMDREVKALKSSLQIHTIKNVQDAKFEFGTIDVFDLDNVDLGELKPGVVTAMAGKAAFEAVVKNIALALDGDIDATVTAPINKESIHKAGHKYSGHTEIYADYTDTKKYAMLLADENFRVIHASTHVSLRQACDLCKKERVFEVITLLHDACKKFGIKNPRIAVAGLNPHAGENQLFGDEEVKEIIPAIEEANSKGYNAEGPFPPDTMFVKAVQGKFDGCVAMYHDQGHIPFKLEGFKWDNEKETMKSVKGVNITLGLPIIRTSVDHGTAFEIAGQGIASADAMLVAIDYAIVMAKNKG
ncbi:4-hydroxythreonine-4-phosphate dehydrogenase PdxA [Aestuariibaculum sp. YM273]|uniref:4-hydroxythreonine-4-phosphate dehydrogenase PdxA n=1 Tax=Aestuariibaculum sp. YM273 TaxID=3070659 RepID=UPI0027DCB119|nr:4-hydroxythreonine-4-phosphate dehydrogenase PdxA [Aestuariibaculum sp. YM273]WMI66256.1 4-hydroxythreonine-4-phosphate dehydrogenase PdxA [Aestuariibaculum sp. YM273]